MSLLDLLAPKVAYAAFNTAFLSKVNREITNPLILFLFALAVLYFLWGMLECLMNQNDEEGRTKCREHMLWGIIGITIMMCVWAILNIILNTLNIPTSRINVEQGTVNLGP
jgi:uncharacterized membrane protein YidH (DUF202 family)